MILRILFVLCLPLLAFSQSDSSAVQLRSNSHYFFVGIAVLTSDNLCDGYHPGRPTTFDYANKGPQDGLSIAYQYRVLKRFYMGATLVVEQQHGDWLDNYIPGGNVFNLQTTVKGAFIRTSVTTAVDIVFDYFSSPICRIYTVAGMGVTHEYETDEYNPEFYNRNYYMGKNSLGAMEARQNKSRFNGYYAPVGLLIGKNVCGFLEVGFGYRGVLNAGVSYNFHKKGRSHV